MRIPDQAKADIRKIEAEHGRLTPEEIVTLTALSVRACRSRQASRRVHAQRLAFLPKDSFLRARIVLREPTLAHELWLERVREIIDTRDERLNLFVEGFALSRDAEKLPRTINPGKVRKIVLRFAAKRLSRFTKAQLGNALDFVRLGSDWTASEQRQRQTDGESAVIGLLTEMRKLRLAISVDDALKMTPSELAEAINRTNEIDGRFDEEANHDRAFSIYTKARNEIRARK